VTLRKIQPLSALSFRGITAGGADMERPRFIDLDPRQLLVDDAYQRDTSQRSIRLIRDIVRNWDWRNYKPPVVVQIYRTVASASGKYNTPDGYHVIDGQHTAIAAASHPRIKLIPVMLVEAETIQDRARAFIGQNTNRLSMTELQLFKAGVAAGDEDAVTVQQICQRARVEIVLNPHMSPKPRRTTATSTLKAMSRRRGAMVTRQILEAVADSNVMPITMTQLRAAEHLTRVVDDALTFAELTAAIKMVPAFEAQHEAARLAKETAIPVYQALAQVWGAYHRAAQQNLPATFSAKVA